MRISATVGGREVEIDVERENGQYRVVIDGVAHLVDAHKLEGDFYSILAAGVSHEVSVERLGDGYRVRRGAAERVVSFSDPGRRAREAMAADGPEQVVSAMPGKVVRLLVKEGDEVAEGQGLAVVEAMKMENEIAAPRAGRVTTVPIAPGQTVEAGAILAIIE